MYDIAYVFSLQCCQYAMRAKAKAKASDSVFSDRTLAGCRHRAKAKAKDSYTAHLIGKPDQPCFTII